MTRKPKRTTTHARSVGFPPVAAASARVLILGSLPGTRSLADNEYYAQPQNAFWRIMGALIGAGPDLEYAHRLARMRLHGLALWDVVASAVRAGSMDSAIERGTIEPNDFAAFFAAHSRIALVCFNGRTAEELWMRLVAPRLQAPHGAIATTVLPSTSPAYAGMPLSEKLRRWRAAIGTHVRGAGSHRPR